MTLQPYCQHIIKVGEGGDVSEYFAKVILSLGWYCDIISGFFLLQGGS